jgi:hypothetical protein
MRRGTTNSYPVRPVVYRPRMDRWPSGQPSSVLTTSLHRVGLRGWHLHSFSIGSIGLCVALWIRAKTVDQEERGNAERRALFVGLWPPMFWLMGDSIDRAEAGAAKGGRLRLRSATSRRPT